MALIALLRLAPDAALAQERPGPAAGATLVDVALSSDTVAFGDEVELTVRLLVPAGQRAWVPALVPPTERVEGVRPVLWSSEPADGGSRSVSLTYPLVPFRDGSVETPELLLALGPAEEGASVVQPFDPGGIGPDPALARLVVPAQSLWVASLLAIEDVTQGLEPRPADDVVGASWSAPAVLSALLFVSLLVAVGFVSARDALAARARAETATTGAVVDPRAAARRAALDELDRLLAAGLPKPDGAEAFYRSSSEVVRRYVEHFDARWSPAYTSTELMRGLEDSGRSEAMDGLLREMWTAEVVKFGRFRPDAAAALEHCRTLRSWVAAS